MSSKLKIKGPQICAISDKFIKVSPGHKGSLHDSILKLRNDLANVVIKVRPFLFSLKLRNRSVSELYLTCET